MPRNAGKRIRQAWGHLRRSVAFAADHSLLLIAGAGLGLLWANASPESYAWAKGLRVLAVPWPGPAGQAAWHYVSLQYLVNDVLMAFFFGLVGKQVWEAFLPDGPLWGIRRAPTPVLCAAGGMAGPALLYLALVALTGRWTALRHGWAIPCATDIAFSFLIARFLFGRAHAATKFLLLLAIADDALGLLILVVFYPALPVRPQYLLLPAAAIGGGLLLRWHGVRTFWWYLAGPGVLSWLGFGLAGFHPALSLLPVIPTMPHGRAAGKLPYVPGREHRGTLDRFEDWWQWPVEGILGCFGLFNAGVSLGAAGAATWIILVALLVGKPVGICASGFLGVKLLGLRLSEGIGWRGLAVLGCAAGIGFTVALFVASVAFPAGPVQDAARMGALASCAAVGTSLAAARALKLGRS